MKAVVDLGSVPCSCRLPDDSVSVTMDIRTVCNDVSQSKHKTLSIPTPTGEVSTQGCVSARLWV